MMGYISTLLLLIITTTSVIVSSFALTGSQFFPKELFIALGTVVSCLFFVIVAKKYSNGGKYALGMLIIGELFFLCMLVYNFKNYGYILTTLLGGIGTLAALIQIRKNNNIYWEYIIYLGVILFLQWYLYILNGDIIYIFINPLLWIHAFLVCFGGFLLIETRIILSNDKSESIKTTSIIWQIVGIIFSYCIAGYILQNKGVNIFCEKELAVTVIISLMLFIFLFFTQTRTIRRLVFIGAIAFFATLHYSFLETIHPTNNKPWIDMFQKVPHVEFIHDMAHIYDIRDFRYNTVPFTVIPRWYDAIYDLNKISSVDYIVNPYALGENVAHTFLSFGFDDGTYVSISIEGRKTSYGYSNWDIFRWKFHQFEKIYIIADEKDILMLRGIIWGEKLYRYPLKMPRNDMKSLFIDMLQTANTLKDTPEFIGPIDNCTRILWRKHMSKVFPKAFPFVDSVNTFTLFAWNSDKFVFDKKLIEINGNFETMKKNAYISDDIKKYQNDENFSKKIRSN